MATVKKYMPLGRKLMLNTLSFISSILILLLVTLGVAVRNYYYNAVSQWVSRYARSFESLSVADPGSYAASARQLAEAFNMKTGVEIQFLDQNGNIIVSTNGFLPTTQEPYGDYAEAAANGDIGTWTGKLSSGEKVMSACVLLADYGSGSNGAVRCVTSLSQVNRQILFVIVISGVVGLMALFMAYMIGKYFVQSIVRPLHDVSQVAREIAGGDFKSRIEIRELNEIGELCDSINYMAGELESTEQLKNEFISSVSHELRTPLTAIKGWGETVRDSVYTDHALVTKGIDVILRESERLSGLVEELLDFSRMQSGRMVYKMEKLDILAELGEAVCMYEEAAKKAGVTLIYHEPESLPGVIGDSNRLTQVFVNIIDNAIKYNHEGGVVQVRAKADEAGIRITVNDSGVGIPAADLDKVKEKFYKANKTVRGSGIGLAVADEIVRHHQGTLTVESAEGIGTTVTVLLPTIPESQPEKTETEDEHER